MNLVNKKTDFIEYVENCLTDFSSFEELSESYDIDYLMELIEDDDQYEKVEKFLEDDEYSYFLNTYLKSLENLLKNYEEEDFYELLIEFLAEEISEISTEEIDKFFSWNS